MTLSRHDVEKLLAGGALLLFAGAVVHGLDAFFETRPLAALAIGLFATDLVARRLGAQWQEEDALPGRALALRVLSGAAVGLFVAMLVLVGGRVLGLAQLGHGTPTVLGIVLGAVRPMMTAARDELLFRGIPLAIAKGRVADRWVLPFCGLLGAAPLVAAGAGPAAVALAIGSGLLYALLWRRGRGGWLAWGAHAGFLFAVDVGMRGALFDVVLTRGALGPASRASGWPAWTAAALFATLGIAEWIHREGQGDPEPGSVRD